MTAYLRRLVILIFMGLSVNACMTTKPMSIAPLNKDNISRCHIIYDAGSSGTRLYIYQHKKDEWIEHQGAKVAALADPIRANRGKSFKDLNAVIDEVITALDSIRQDGALDQHGKAKWQAFDWQTDCQLASVQVLATAGMRLAEYENRKNSHLLWQTLKQKLQEKLGTTVPITAHTLTGFEEGLFTWLAVKETRKDNAFGIAEMGGASAQITFPCTDCRNEKNAVHPVIIDDKVQKMYSYSFLGLGQDEAAKTLGLPTSCEYGIATKQLNWKINHCYQHINLSEFKGLRDPYNFQAQRRGSHHQIPVYQTAIKHWVLTGAFNYDKDEDIQNCCINKGQCYQAETACFRPIYLRKYLHLMGIPITSEKQNARWTRGAMLCAETHCLAKVKNSLSCRWSAQGCLK